MKTVRQRTSELAGGVRSALAMTDEALAAIAAPQGEGARAFTRAHGQRARADASASDTRRTAGQPLGLLDGLPIAIKDLFDVAGETTLAGSTVLAGRPAASADADVVARLRAAGAVIVGKTNMTEFAFSGLGLNPHYGTPANPWERAAKRIPGGSSSGSGVAVVDGMCAAAIGTDTGGSVRIPAALCGVAGFKPTASTVSMRGALPLSPSLDSIGVLAPTVDCCARVHAFITDTPSPVPAPRSLQGVRFLIPGTLVQDGLDADVAHGFSLALARLSAAGAILVDAPFPEFGELAQLHAKGTLPAFEAWTWHRALIEEHGGDYDPRVLARLLGGRAMDAADYRELQARRLAWQGQVNNRLAGFDALLMPTVPIVAPLLAPLVEDDALFARTNALMLRNPSTINFLNGCAASIPCHDPGHAPVGLTVAGGAHRDEAVLAISIAVDAALRAATGRLVS